MIIGPIFVDFHEITWDTMSKVTPNQRQNKAGNIDSYKYNV